MSKSPAKIISASANSPFMQKLQRDNDLTDQRVTEIVYDFVFGNTKLSLVAFAEQSVS